MKNKSHIIGISLVFWAVFGSCAANNINMPEMTVIANGTPEGISLHIGNIPEDALYLSVSLHNITANDQMFTGALFQDNELEQLRVSGSLLCPFVKYGYEYEITVTALGILTNELQTINSTVTTALANGGIYMTNNPVLIWNSHNVITFSEKPVFTDEKTNSQDFELRYGLVFRTGETNSQFTFDNSHNFDSIVKRIGNTGLNGNILIHAEAELYIEHENIEWAKVFARTDDYVISTEIAMNTQAPFNISLAAK